MFYHEGLEGTPCVRIVLVIYLIRLLDKKTRKGG